jgi:maltose O-acetyltransferase
VILYDADRGLVRFGCRVAVAAGVSIIASSNPNNSRIAELTGAEIPLICEDPVTIEDDAWLGANAVILPGVTIGRGAQVGAGAVVIRDVADFDVVAGVPAHVVLSRQPPPFVARPKRRARRIA